MLSFDVRITRLERDGDAGWYFAFLPDSRATLDAAMQYLGMIPTHNCRWVPGEKAWWISDSAIKMVAANFAGAQMVLADYRVAELDGNSYTTGKWRAYTTGSSAYSTSSARPTGKWDYIPQNVRNAFDLLNLTPDASPEMITAARRVHAQRVHPDKGGSHEAMKRVNEAADIATAWAASHV